MPTGYTSDVQDGKVTDFATFAMNCARAFGALIVMRDEPLSATIPDEFPPSNRHADELQKAFAELAELSLLSTDDVHVRAAAEFEKLSRQHAEYVARKETELARYTDMLNKVLAWTPPTEKHVELKKFMVEQLTESMRWDCGSVWEPPVAEPPHEWLSRQLKRVRDAIQYHTQANKEEIERTADRNQWVKALRASLQ